MGGKHGMMMMMQNLHPVFKRAASLTMCLFMLWGTLTTVSMPLIRTACMQILPQYTNADTAELALHPPHDTACKCMRCACHTYTQLITAIQCYMEPGQIGISATLKHYTSTPETTGHMT